MSTKITKKRVTVYCNESDINLLLQLCIDNAGASDPELFRMGLRSLARQPCAVRIMPQMAPPANMRAVLAGVRGFTRLLDMTVRNGWPDHIDGESAERHKRVKAARKDFELTLKQMLPAQRTLMALVSAMAVLPGVDIESLTRASLRVVANSAKYPDYKHLADFMKQIGVLSPIYDKQLNKE
jgi:hypothetical protein